MIDIVPGYNQVNTFLFGKFMKNSYAHACSRPWTQKGVAATPYDTNVFRIYRECDQNMYVTFHLGDSLTSIDAHLILSNGRQRDLRIHFWVWTETKSFSYGELRYQRIKDGTFLFFHLETHMIHLSKIYLRVI